MPEYDSLFVYARKQIPQRTVRLAETHVNQTEIHQGMKVR